MEVQFKSVHTPYLRQRLFQRDELEETMEVKLPPELPDMASIVACWGQCILRSKQWQGDSISVSGGVMVWTLYKSAEDGSVQSLESWIPFQGRWVLPEAGREGVLRSHCGLTGMDGRMISARRMILRAGICVAVEALSPDTFITYAPQQLPADLQLLQRTYPISLPVEAGEKSFQCEDSVYSPVGPMEILNHTALPILREKKVSGQHILFKGCVAGKLVCREGEQIKTVEYELPFSQLAELDQELEEGQVSLLPALTGMEAEIVDGQCRVKCAVTGQFAVYKSHLIQAVEDVYSPTREVQAEKTPWDIPVYLDCVTQDVQLEGDFATGAATVDLCCYLGKPEISLEDGVQTALGGKFTLLTQEEDGSLRSDFQAAQALWSLDASHPAGAQLWQELAALPSLTRGAGTVTGKCKVQVSLQVVSGAMPAMVSGLTFGEQQLRSADSPSLILCRTRKEDTLWSLAKAYKSTVSAIENANDLTEPLQEDCMILIPCCG